MPVLHVHAVLPDELDPQQLAAELARRVERAGDLRPGGLWCFLHDAAGVSMGEARSPAAAAFTLLHRPRHAAHRAQVLRACAEELADVLGLPVEDVWGRSVELSPGEIFAGGRVLLWEHG